MQSVNIIDKMKNYQAIFTLHKKPDGIISSPTGYNTFPVIYHINVINLIQYMKNHRDANKTSIKMCTKRHVSNTKTIRRKQIYEVFYQKCLSGRKFLFFFSTERGTHAIQLNIDSKVELLWKNNNAGKVSLGLIVHFLCINPTWVTSFKKWWTCDNLQWSKCIHKTSREWLPSSHYAIKHQNKQLLMFFWLKFRARKKYNHMDIEDPIQ